MNYFLRGKYNNRLVELKNKRDHIEKSYFDGEFNVFQLEIKYKEINRDILKILNKLRICDIEDNRDRRTKELLKEIVKEMFGKEPPEKVIEEIINTLPCELSVMGRGKGTEKEEYKLELMDILSRYNYCEDNSRQKFWDYIKDKYIK